MSGFVNDLYAQSDTITKADSLLDNGQPSEAAHHYNRLLQTILPDSQYLKVMSNYAWALFKQDKDDSAHLILQKAIQIAIQNDRKTDQAELLFRTSQCWFLRGEDRKAYSAGREATQLPASALLQGKLYNLLGNAATNLGLLDEAIAYYFRSLEEKQKAKASDLELSRTYLNLGGALDEAKKSDDALNYYFQSARLKKAANDSIGLGRLYGNIAVVFKNRKAYKEALSYLDSSTLFSPTPSPVDRYSIYTTRGQILKRTGAYKEAEHYIKEALEAATKAKNRYRIADAYINLSDLSNARGAYQQAVEYAEKADSLARETNSFTQRMHLNSNLATAWKGIGQSARSHHYLSEAFQ